MKLIVISMVALAVAMSGILVFAGATGAQTSGVRVPNLYGKRVPRAEYMLRRAGLRAGKEDCDCTFGMIIKSSWVVCEQHPAAGRVVARGTRVSTYSERDVSDC
jgi:beta-lactam-binding protein with PASTA domain